MSEQVNIWSFFNMRSIMQYFSLFNAILCVFNVTRSCESVLTSNDGLKITDSFVKVSPSDLFLSGMFIICLMSANALPFFLL